MPAQAPDEITAPQERLLWHDLTLAYENHGGNDPAQFEYRRERFLFVLDCLRERLAPAKKKRPTPSKKGKKANG